MAQPDVGRVYLQSVIDCHSRYAWARLYTTKLPVTAIHVLNNDVLPFFEKHHARVHAVISECPDCGGRMHIVAALTDPASIRSYLEGVGLPARPPPIPQARPSQQSELEYAA